MLFKEHVSTLLVRPNIPPEWEEEMEAAGLIPEDESAILKDEAERDKSDDEDISVEYVSSDED